MTVTLQLQHSASVSQNGVHWIYCWLHNKLDVPLVPLYESTLTDQSEWRIASFG